MVDQNQFPVQHHEHPTEAEQMQELHLASQHWPKEHQGLAYLRHHIEQRAATRGIELTTAVPDVSEAVLEPEIAVPDEENNEATREELAQAFRYARSYVNGSLRNSPEFLESLQKNNVAAGDLNKAQYWSTLASLANAQAAQSRKEEGDSPAAHALEIVANTPLFAIEQARMDQLRALNRERTGSDYLRKGNFTPDEKQAWEFGVNYVSFYNNLLRAYGASELNARADDLRTEILMAVEELPNARLRTRLSSDIGSVIRGAQHEILWTETLRGMGWTVDGAHKSEDIKGTDCYVRDGTSDEWLSVDIKSSMHDMHQHGVWDRPWYVHRGKITMYSMFQAEDAGTSFHPTQEQIRMIGPDIVHALGRARHKLHDMRAS